jgi:hypothetical protein
MTDLSTLSLSQLAALYNEHAEKPVKKFACSKEAAIAKVQAVLPKDPTPPKKKPGPKQGIGAMVCELILEKKLSPKDILAKVLETYPSAKTTMKCIYWYFSHLKSTGDLV